MGVGLSINKINLGELCYNSCIIIFSYSVVKRIDLLEYFVMLCAKRKRFFQGITLYMVNGLLNPCPAE